jgi:hypothetical protein
MTSAVVSDTEVVADCVAGTGATVLAGLSAQSSLFEMAARLMADQPAAATTTLARHTRRRVDHCCECCAAERSVWWPCMPVRIAHRAMELAAQSRDVGQASCGPAGPTGSDSA